MNLPPILGFLGLLGLAAAAAVCAEPAFPGATGFGAEARGGRGGKTILVTRLDDNVEDPQPGRFRWAVAQKGPRLVKFAIAGTILLEDRVAIKEPFLTIDGSDAPGMGVCLRGGSLEFSDTHDIVVRYLRVRLGDEHVLALNRAKKRKRPDGSGGLDCIELRRCENVIIDHLSASWSCDELFSVVHCRNVTVQWCLLAEPLANPALHPYGDRHAFGFNASASTLSVHHCLFARYVMRGPQFEANDMRKGDGYAVQMEAVENVMGGYERSGSRYTTGVEDHRDEAAPEGYEFQFLGNVYLGDGDKPMIEAAMKHGVHPKVRVHLEDPALMRLGDTKGREDLIPAAKGQLRDEPLFRTSATNTDSDPEVTLRSVLAGAGCSQVRDAVDARIVGEVQRREFPPVLSSQAEVGGWPELR